MNMTGTIVVLKAGQPVPEKYILPALQENKTCLGAAIIQNKELMLDVIPDMFSMDDPLTDIQEHRKDYPKADLVYFFGNCDEKPLASSIPPFTLVEENGQPIIAVFAEGDVGDLQELSEDLKTEIAGIYRSCEDNIGDTFKSLDTDTVDKRLSRMVDRTGRGCLCFVSSMGDIKIKNIRNEQAEDYPWGFASNSYGYKEAEYPEAKKAEAAEEPVKPGLFKKRRIPGAPVAEEAPTPTPPKEAEKPVEKPVEKVEPKVEPKEDEFVEARPPEGKSGRELSQYYRFTLQVQPPKDVHTRPWVRVKKSVADNAPGVEIKGKETPAKLKETTIKQFSDDKLVTAVPGLLPEGMAEAVKEFMKTKTVQLELDSAPRIIQDPSELLKAEGASPTHFERLGQTPNFSAGILWTTWVDICRRWPEFGARAIIDWRARALTAEKELKAAKPQPEKRRIPGAA